MGSRGGAENGCLSNALSQSFSTTPCHAESGCTERRFSLQEPSRDSSDICSAREITTIQLAEEIGALAQKVSEEEKGPVSFFNLKRDKVQLLNRRIPGRREVLIQELFHPGEKVITTGWIAISFGGNLGNISWRV
jgi:hypothetical protein